MDKKQYLIDKANELIDKLDDIKEISEFESVRNEISSLLGHLLAHYQK